MRSHNVVLIRGDGIGPEILDATTTALGTLQDIRKDFRLSYDYREAGANYYRRTNTVISPETVEACRNADATLKGPSGDFSVRRPDGTEAGTIGLALRPALDVYANVRPIRLFPGVKGPLDANAAIDYVIVRESSEGSYASRFQSLGAASGDKATDTIVMTRQGVERVVRFAFELARTRNGAPRDGMRRVTCVDKANVLVTYAFFRSVFDEIGEQYPEIEKQHLYADAVAQEFVLNPSRFDVLVMENLLGDILSDLGAATVGGLGLCGSGLYGSRTAYFEAIHGSAPDIAGKGLANPVSLMNAAVMMLEKLGEREAADQLQQAISSAFREKKIVLERPNGRPVGGTTAVTEAVINQLYASRR